MLLQENYYSKLDIKNFKTIILNWILKSKEDTTSAGEKTSRYTEIEPPLLQHQ